jgi:uridylate kinase
MPQPRRILLKISGEMLSGGKGTGYDDTALDLVVREISDSVGDGVQIAVVCGGGNLLRGAGPNPSALAVESQMKDTMGMLATTMNALALTSRLRQAGLEAVHMAAFPGIPFSQAVSAQDACEALDRGSVVLFSGGTGLPFFSTDMAAAVRALQVGASMLLKGTQVAGVYSADPRKDPGARFLPQISARDALVADLRFMDPAALALCGYHGLEVVVFDAHQAGNLRKVLKGELTCSRISPNKE